MKGRTAVRYRVLGPLDVVADDGRGAVRRRPQAANRARRPHRRGRRAVSVDRLLQAMYGEDAAPSNRATLHTYVSNLRRTLGDVIVRQGDGYVLRSDRLDDRRRRVRGRLPGRRERRSSRTRWRTDCASALLMWRGHPYADVEGHGSLDGEITRLNEVASGRARGPHRCRHAGGAASEVVAELEALTVEHPFRENLRAMHMLALYRCGRQGEALRAYGRTRTALVEGLGIDPSPRAAGDGAADPRPGSDVARRGGTDGAATGGASWPTSTGRGPIPRPVTRRSPVATRSWTLPPAGTEASR